MKVLVTGAAGFIGSNFAESLVERGISLVGVDNYSDYYSIELKQENSRQLEKLGVEVLNIDLREPNLKDLLPKDITHIFHFAAQPGLSSSCTFDDYLSNNVYATKNLLEYASSLLVRPYFINISTSSVYGCYATRSEDQIPEPTSWYGVTKLMSEQLVLAASRSSVLSACSFRLYSVYGPKERPDKMFSKLLYAGIHNTSFNLYKGSAEHSRSFTYVSDIIDGLLLFFDNQEACKGEIFNLGSEVEYSTSEGIKAVEAVIGKSIQLIPTDSRSGDQLKTCAVIDKARRILGYNPTTSLEQGIRKQLAWMQR